MCSTSTLESNLRFSVIFNARYSRQNLFSSPSISNNKIADNIFGTYFRPLWTAKDTFIHTFRHPGKWFKAGYCQGRQFGRVVHNGLHTSRMLFCMCVMMNLLCKKDNHVAYQNLWGSSIPSQAPSEPFFIGRNRYAQWLCLICA